MNRQNIHRPESLVLNSSSNKPNLHYDLSNNNSSSSGSNNENPGNNSQSSNKRTPILSATPTMVSSSRLNNSSESDKIFEEQEEHLEKSSPENNNTLTVPQLLSATSSAFPGGIFSKSPLSPGYQDKVKSSRKFYTWSKFEVHTWVSNINDLIKIKMNTEISRTFIENNITGDLLPFLTMQHFSDMNIQELKPKLILKKHINLLLESHMDIFGNDENDEYVESLSNSPLMDDNLKMLERYLMNVSDKILSNIDFSTCSAESNSSTSSSFSASSRSAVNSNNSNIHHHRHHYGNPTHNNASGSSTPRLMKRMPDIDPKNMSSPSENVSALGADGQSFTNNGSIKNDNNNDTSISGTPGHSSFISDYEDDADNTFFDDTIDSSMISSGNNTLDDISVKHKESLELLNGTNTNNTTRYMHDTHQISSTESKKPPFEMKYDSVVESSPLNSPLLTPLSKKPSSSSTATLANSGSNMVNSKPTLTVATPSAYQAAQSSLQTPHSATYPTPPILSKKSSSSNFQSSSSSLPKSEPLKQLKAKYDDPCYKVLQKAMIKHKINNVDWRNYVLVICYGDKERILRPEEKPVKVFKELQERGQHPSFMIRQLEGASPSQDSFDYSAGDSSR